MNHPGTGVVGDDHGGAIGFAFLAIASFTAFILLLRGAMAVWPVGVAGTLSRLISVLLLGLWVGMRGRRWRRLAVGEVGGWLLLMGALSAVINLCWFAGMKWTTATNATLLFRADVLFVLLIGAVLGLERLTAAAWAVVPLMLLGFALLMEVQTLDWGGHARGDLLIIISALGLAVNAFVIRHILRSMDGEAVALYNHAFSGLAFAILMFVEGPRIPQAALAHPAQWIWIVAVGVIAAVSLPLYYAALRRLAVWKLRVLMLLSPPLGAFAEWVFWGATLNPGQWVGAAFLLAGAAALVLGERTPAAPAGAGAPPHWGSHTAYAGVPDVSDFHGTDDTERLRLDHAPELRSLTNG